LALHCEDEGEDACETYADMEKLALAGEGGVQQPEEGGVQGEGEGEGEASQS
jgi:hypothetical protein